jgi:hypothetical protein
VRRLVLVLLFAALALPAHARASTPAPWCGTDSAAFDRTPDFAPGFSIHVVYAYPAGAPDRFAAWAPHIVGDVAAIDAWWRSQDAARTPRFDLHAFGCDSAFGSLDLSRVPLSTSISDIRTAHTRIRQLLANEHGFDEQEKVYLVYFDGPTGQIGEERICGEADAGRRGFAPMALVYLDSCGSGTGDESRVIVAVHELVHALGGIDGRSAPSVCNQGHVCDAPNDLMTARLENGPLESRVLDAGRNDYYGHSGSWFDVQDARHLERLDSPDRAAPFPPTQPMITNDRTGRIFFRWGASTDDVGPVTYRVYRDGTFFDEVDTPAAVLEALLGSTSVYAVRAVDSVGRMSHEVSLRFTAGLGIVDANGRLIRDTVPPGAVTAVVVRKLRQRVALSWRAPRDGGGILGYRVRVGSRLMTTARAGVSLARVRITGAVRITPVDLAGNAGPTTTIPLRRLR